MRRRAAAFLVSALMFLGGSAWAQDGNAELQGLKARVDELEKRVKDVEPADETGHRLHPIHSLYGLKVSGWITITAQGMDRENNTENGQAAISADIALETPVGENGRGVIVLDFENGTGLGVTPSLFVGPNGNPTGPNADIESFNNNRVHLTQAYYEHDINERLVLSVGQLDITGYFDGNEYANNERTQFLANVFVNNPTVEFGGSADFYAIGARATLNCTDAFNLSLGAFEGDGDYIDAFDSPFLIAEAGLKLTPLGRDGNYRVYYWSRQGRPSVDNTANPADVSLLNKENKGLGISIDQSLADGFGVWLRAGTQDKRIARFDRSVSGGVHLSGVDYGRPNDDFGIGYGATFIGQDYKDIQRAADANFDPGAEHYMEVYYNYAVAHADPDKGFHITPDFQYVINSGGNKNAEEIFIYGVRLQTFF